MRKCQKILVIEEDKKKTVEGLSLWAEAIYFFLVYYRHTISVGCEMDEKIF